MKPLGPDEGINALRHPGCRFCDEYQRLMRGPTEEVRQLKKKVAELEGGDAHARSRGHHEPFCDVGQYQPASPHPAEEKLGELLAWLEERVAETWKQREKVRREHPHCANISGRFDAKRTAFRAVIQHIRGEQR